MRVQAPVSHDHQLRDNIQLSVGANHNRVHNVPTVMSFVTLFGFDPDINLLAPGDLRGTKYRISPDSSTPSSISCPRLRCWWNTLIAIAGIVV